MVLIDKEKRRLTITLLYVGPAGAGKRSSLRCLGERLQSPVVALRQGAGIGFAVDARLFRSGPLDYECLLRAICVPRLPLFPQEFQSCLSEVDGLIFVADSQLRRLEANQRALDELRSGLRTMGQSLEQIPHAFQWNKCEMPDALLPQDLERRFNPLGVLSATSTALLNLHVFDLMLALYNETLERMGFDLTGFRYSETLLKKAVGRKRWPPNE